MVQPCSVKPNWYPNLNLNTSNVMVQRLHFSLLQFHLLNLNTSNVMVQRGIQQISSPLFKI